MMRELEHCEICQEEFDPEDLAEFGGSLMCPECLDNSTILCDHCGARLWRTDNAGDEDIYLCRRCYDEYYTTCERCGQIIRDTEAHYADEDTPLCGDCWRERSCRCGIQP